MADLGRWWRSWWNCHLRCRWRLAYLGWTSVIIVISKPKMGEKGWPKECMEEEQKTLIVRVPQGTTVRDAETGKGYYWPSWAWTRVYRCSRWPRWTWKYSFCNTPKNPAPEISENGDPGQERELQLELKILGWRWFGWFPFCWKINSAQRNYLSKTKNWCLPLYNHRS